MGMGIKFKAAGWVKWLRAEQIDHVISRQVVVVPLPGQSSGIPLSFSVDLGIMSQDIVLRGAIKDNDPLHASGAASWRDIRHMVIRSWRELIFSWNDPLNPQNTAKIGYYPQKGGTVWYRCLPTRLEMGREGGKGQWDYALTLAVVAWPPVNYEI